MQAHAPRRWVWATATGLVLGSAACTLILDHQPLQCRSNADCTQFGNDISCMGGVCTGSADAASGRELLDGAAVSPVSAEATTQSGLDATGGGQQDHAPITNGGTGLDGTTTTGDGSSAAADVVTANGDSAAAPDSSVDGGNDAALSDAGSVSTLGMGLVALYLFDETTGTTSADASGNSGAAVLHGATFTPGLVGNAVNMTGGSQYVALPIGIVSGLKSFSVSAWVYVNISNRARIFDFGTGPTTYMFFTPETSPARFAITTAGQFAENRIDEPTLTTVGSWQHTVVTLTGGTGTLYVNGVQTAQNTTMTLNPSSLGATNQNWLGRSQYATDPYLNGRIDNFRIYNRALTASEVLQLFQQQL